MSHTRLDTFLRADLTNTLLPQREESCGHDGPWPLAFVCVLFTRN